MQKIRVLIVDDETEVVTTLRDVLIERTNYDVRVATSGFEAGVECERFRPHVILMDVHLGDAEPSQLSDLIRSNGQLQMTRLLAMSGKLTDGQASTIRSAESSSVTGPNTARTACER